MNFINIRFCCIVVAYEFVAPYLSHPQHSLFILRKEGDIRGWRAKLIYCIPQSSHPQQSQGLSSAILSTASHSDDRERCNRIEDERIFSSAILRKTSILRKEEVFLSILSRASAIVSTASLS